MTRSEPSDDEESGSWATVSGSDDDADAEEASLATESNNNEEVGIGLDDSDLDALLDEALDELTSLLQQQQNVVGSSP